MSHGAISWGLTAQDTGPWGIFINQSYVSVARHGYFSSPTNMVILDKNKLSSDKLIMMYCLRDDSTPHLFHAIKAKQK